MATEQRLIDANALIEEMKDCAITRQDLYCNGYAQTFIENAPPVDAVEVVRCKDCKHYMTIYCTCDGCCISDDWYCADGERRTDHV